MTMSLAIERLTSLLEGELSDHGYQLRTTDGSFVKKSNFGFLQIDFVGHREAEQHVFTPLLSIRHNVVEDIVNRLGDIFDKASQRKTPTVVRGLIDFPFDGGRDRRMHIDLTNLERESERAALALDDLLRQYGFAFLDRYSSLEECVLGLNDPIGGMVHPMGYRFQARAYRGLAAAGLVQPERVPELVEAYVSYANENPDAVDNLPFPVGQGLPKVAAFVQRMHFISEQVPRPLN